MDDQQATAALAKTLERMQRDFYQLQNAIEARLATALDDKLERRFVPFYDSMKAELREAIARVAHEHAKQVVDAVTFEDLVQAELHTAIRTEMARIRSEWRAELQVIAREVLAAGVTSSLYVKCKPDLDKIVPKVLARDIRSRLRKLTDEVWQEKLAAEQADVNQAGLMQIDEFGWTARTRHALENEGIKTIQALTLTTEAELLRIPNFGRVSLREVKEQLKELGLTLGMRNG